MDQGGDDVVFHRVVEYQCVGDKLVAGPQSGNDFDHLVGQCIADGDFLAAEDASSVGHVNPLAVMQVQNSRRGNLGVLFHGRAVEGGGPEQPHAHQVGIVHFPSDFS